MENTNLKSNQKAYPGMFLGYAYDYSIGETGVYRKDDKIIASLSGEVLINENCSPPKISIQTPLNDYTPKIGDEVYGRITKVHKSGANVEILATKSKSLRTAVIGTLKSENVKSDFHEIEMTDCFVPGDVVLCKIISIDQTNYIYLSTTDVNHGVVFARSPLTKNIMMPVSFEKMLCLDTKISENRKVAKPSII